MKIKRKPRNQDVIDNYNPEEDIIIPNSIFGELYYVWCMWKELKNCSGLEYFKKYDDLKRQIRLFFSWLCHR